MKKYLITLSLILSIFLLQFFNPKSAILANLMQEKPYKAKIEVIRENLNIEIFGKFINNSDSTLFIKYEMKTSKIGQSGTSLSSQSGKYISEPNSILILNRVGLNMDKKAEYKISCQVFENNILIAEDSLSLNIKEE